MEASHVKSEERARIIRNLPARERYLAMKALYPYVFIYGKATTEQLATFLGLSRETLSRVINKEKQTPEEAYEEERQWAKVIETAGFPV